MSIEKEEQNQISASELEALISAFKAEMIVVDLVIDRYIEMAKFNKQPVLIFDTYRLYRYMRRNNYVTKYVNFNSFIYMLKCLKYDLNKSETKVKFNIIF